MAYTVKETSGAVAGGKEEGTSLTPYEFNLWNRAAPMNDPDLSLGWGPKKRQSGPDQTTSGSRSVIYTLDLMGNRTDVSDAGVNKSYVVNNHNQYSTGHGLAVGNGTSHEISSYDGTGYQYIGDTYLAKATAGTRLTPFTTMPWAAA